MLPALLLRDLATNKSAFTSATLILRTLSLTTRKIAKDCNTAQITLFLSPADLPRAVLCLQHSGCYQTQMGKKKNDSKANGVQLPSSVVFPVQLPISDAMGPFCGYELDADGPILPLGICSSLPSRGLQSSEQDFGEGRLAAPAGVSGASSKVALINEHMCSEESYSIPLKLLTWSASGDSRTLLIRKELFCNALGLDGSWIAPRDQVPVRAACLSAASSKRVVFLVFSFSRSAQPDGLFSNALCVGWMCVWRVCQLHEKEERAKEREKSTIWYLSLGPSQS